MRIVHGVSAVVHYEIAQLDVGFYRRFDVLTALCIVGRSHNGLESDVQAFLNVQVALIKRVVDNLGGHLRGVYFIIDRGSGKQLTLKNGDRSVSEIKGFLGCCGVGAGEGCVPPAGVVVPVCSSPLSEQAANGTSTVRSISTRQVNLMVFFMLISILPLCGSANSNQ